MSLSYSRHSHFHNHNYNYNYNLATTTATTTTMSKLHPDQTTMCSSCDMLLKVKDLADHLKICCLFSE